MNRAVIADNSIEEYLQKLSKLPNISVGLVIGQPDVKGKDYVVHLTRTVKDEIPEESENTNSFGLDDFVVSHHALNVMRMLPAGMFILGTFIVSPTDLFTDQNSVNCILTWIQEIKSLVKTYRLLYCDLEKVHDNQMLVLHYSSTTKTINCKIIENVAITKSINWEFQDLSSCWTLIETFYELNEIFPILRRNEKFHMEENFGSSLEVISDQIMKSFIFLNDTVISKDAIDLNEFTKEFGDSKALLQAVVYYPSSEMKQNRKNKIGKYEGSVHYLGAIGCKIWLHPNNTMEKVKFYIKTDIIRSLAARIQIHCDVLIENDHIDNHLHVNEPPRRIFFKTKCGGIQFSDYVFRAEDDESVIRQIKENFDLDVQKQDLICNVELLQ